MKEPLIRVEHVSFEYTLNRQEIIPVLSDLSFTVYPGEYVAIIGQNGSGKSTLSKHLNGLLKPKSGDVWIKGMNTKDQAKQREIRKTIGMVFQHPDNQIVATIVEDDVAFGLENIEVPHCEMKERIDLALEAVGMSEFRKRPPHFLSGGQKQRIAIAGTIAMQTECLVLDEATSMLDAYGRKEILQVIRKLNQKGVAIVTVTHHMSEVTEADRVLVIEQGKIVLSGTPREIFAQKELLYRLHLDIPQVSQMAERIHREEPDFPADLIHKDELIQEVIRFRAKKEVSPG